MTTKEQIKSTYRVCQIGDKYYIQVNTLFGWSFHTGSGDDFQVFLILVLLVFIIVFIISIVVALVTKEYNPGITITSIGAIITFLTFQLYSLKSKKLSINCNSLVQAENYIDSFVNSEYNKLIEKEKEKEVKYHYFYTPNQVRKEKLKKLK